MQLGLDLTGSRYLLWMSSKDQCCAESFILREEAFASRVNFILYSGDLGMDHGVESQGLLWEMPRKRLLPGGNTPTSLESGKTRRHSTEELRRWLGERAEFLLHKHERRSLYPISPQKSWAQELHTVRGGRWWGVVGILVVHFVGSLS